MQFPPNGTQNIFPMWLMLQFLCLIKDIKRPCFGATFGDSNITGPNIWGLACISGTHLPSHTNCAAWPAMDGWIMYNKSIGEGNTSSTGKPTKTNRNQHDKMTTKRFLPHRRLSLWLCCGFLSLMCDGATSESPAVANMGWWGFGEPKSRVDL